MHPRLVRNSSPQLLNCKLLELLVVSFFFFFLTFISVGCGMHAQSNDRLWRFLSPEDSKDQT